MSATVTIQSASQIPANFGDFDIGPFSITGTITPVFMSAILASGNNAFTVPASSRGVIVTPPTSSAIVLISKTTSGDTGQNRPQGTPWIECFDPSNVPATYYINAASLTVGNTTLIFF